MSNFVHYTLVRASFPFLYIALSVSRSLKKYIVSIISNIIVIYNNTINDIVSIVSLLEEA